MPILLNPIARVRFPVQDQQRVDHQTQWDISNHREERESKWRSHDVCVLLWHGDWRADRPPSCEIFAFHGLCVFCSQPCREAGEKGDKRTVCAFSATCAEPAQFGCDSHTNIKFPIIYFIANLLVINNSKKRKGKKKNSAGSLLLLSCFWCYCIWSRSSPRTIK